MKRLLDVNVLLALVDAASIHHERVHAWVESVDDFRWTSCTITENGFSRVLSSPAYPRNVRVFEAVGLLRGLRDGLRGHEFWECDLSLTEDRYFEWELVQGAKQITDLYLLALAVSRRAKLVTFDRKIRWRAVRGATEESVELLG